MISPELKSLYRQIARLVHPDAGAGVDDGFDALRAKLMAQASAAYDKKDFRGLQAVFERWETRHQPEAIQNEPIAYVERRSTRYTKPVRPRPKPAAAPVAPAEPPRDDIHAAARRGQWPEVEAFLNAGDDVNAAMASGRTILHAAAEGGFVRLTEMLLARGATAVVADRTGVTPLHLAARGGHVAVIDLLLAAGAAPSAISRPSLVNPLHEAAMNKHWEALTHLVAPDAADLDAAMKDGRTLLHLVIAAGQIAIATDLLDREADPNAKDKNGQRPIHLAALAGDPTLTALLLQHGADVNAADRSSATALHLSAMGESEELTMLLIRHKADLNAIDRDNRTPLHVAIAAGNAIAVGMLLQAGAKAELKWKGRTAAEIAVNKRDVSLTRALMSAPPSPLLTEQIDRSFLLAMEEQNLDMLDAILELSMADRNAFVRKGFQYALSKWLAGRTPPTLRVLLKYPSHLDSQAFLQVVDSGDAELLKMVVQAIANVDAPAVIREWSVLHVTAMSGIAPLVKKLLDSGANVNAPDQLGRNALHLSVVASTRTNFPEFKPVMQLLMNAGVDQTAVTANGMSAVDLAIIVGNTDLVEYLKPKDPARGRRSR